MKVSGPVHIQLQLDSFEYPSDVYSAIRAEVGDVSPARMLSEYIYRLLQQTPLQGAITQVSAVPSEWKDT